LHVAASAAVTTLHELTLAPGGHVGEHNHEGPGIRQVTSGYMTYVLPDKTVHPPSGLDGAARGLPV
jgi:quercetin dioxygenase-like cupin family protein